MFSAHVRALFVLLLFAGPAAAQAERYELGRRLRLFEAAWEIEADEGRRKKALGIIEDVTPKFFGLKLGEAGRTLDDARFALSKTPPTDATRWLTALYAVPEVRLIDADRPTLAVTVKPFYKSAVPAPDATATLALGLGPPVPVDLSKLPAKVEVAVPKGHDVRDLDLVLECRAGRSSVSAAVNVSVMKDLARWTGHYKRLAAAAVGHYPEGRTVKAWAEAFVELAGGEVPETDCLVARRHDEVQEIIALLKKQADYFTPDRPGDFAVSFPLDEKWSAHCRLFVPKKLAAGKPVPLVVALHGASGSENLFFDGYGSGQIVRECEKRGWLLVAPRSRFGLLHDPEGTKDLVEQIGLRYPVDPKRRFVVGHSMGAGEALEYCVKNPGLFAAAAMLGGAQLRGVTPKAFANTPTFFGVGEKDAFTLELVRKASKSLAGTPTTLKEYPDVEHMLIVRVALPDVFAAWDKLAK